MSGKKVFAGVSAGLDIVAAEVAMRLALVVLTTFTLLGCSGDGVPPTAPASPLPTSSNSPSPTQDAPAWVWAMVVGEDGSGLCILDATVEVVAGQGLGQRATQSEPCDIWWVGGVEFKNLTAGVEITLRASASGYVPEEKTVIPTTGGQMATIFALRRNPAP
jgi:hypothetical protein